MASETQDDVPAQQRDTWTPVVGKYGRTRDGRKTGQILLTGSEVFSHRGLLDDKVETWLADGSWSLTVAGHVNDLVSEWIDDPEPVAESSAPEQPSPVRYVTKPKIVPGTYGIVDVGMGGEVSILCGRYTAEQLRAAATTLILLAMAKEDQQP